MFKLPESPLVKPTELATMLPVRLSVEPAPTWIMPSTAPKAMRFALSVFAVVPPLTIIPAEVKLSVPSRPPIPTLIPAPVDAAMFSALIVRDEPTMLVAVAKPGPTFTVSVAAAELMSV